MYCDLNVLDSIVFITQMCLHHPVFSNVLVGLPIQIACIGDGILLGTSHHWYPEKSGVEIAHVCDRRVLLVEGTLMVDDFPNSL